MTAAFQQPKLSDLWMPHAEFLTWLINFKATHQLLPSMDQACEAAAIEPAVVTDLIAQGYIQLTEDNQLAASDQWVELPIIGNVAAGSPIEAVAHQHGQMSLPLDCFRQRPTYLLRVRGDSMIDEGINDGDLIAVRKTHQAGEGKIVVARVDNEVTVKRLKLMKDKVGLMPANKDYQPILVAPEALVIEGEFVGLIRGGRPSLAH